MRSAQLELNLAGVRDTAENRERFAAAFADVFVYYGQTQMGAGLATPSLR